MTEPVPAGGASAPFSFPGPSLQLLWWTTFGHWSCCTNEEERGFENEPMFEGAQQGVILALLAVPGGGLVIVLWLWFSRARTEVKAASYVGHALREAKRVQDIHEASVQGEIDTLRQRTRTHDEHLARQRQRIEDLERYRGMASVRIREQAREIERLKELLRRAELDRDEHKEDARISKRLYMQMVDEGFRTRQ